MRIEVKEPGDCPFRYYGIIVHVCNIAKDISGKEMICEDHYKFPDECPLKEKGYIAVSANINKDSKGKKT